MSHGRFTLEGKTALVTGGGRGIGLALSCGLRDAGASVAVFERDIPEDIPEGIKMYQVDLADHKELEENFKQFLNDFGSIHVLVNNAGITKSAASESYDFKDWQQTLDVNLTAVFVLCQLAGRCMIEQKQAGSIINVTSIGGAQGFPNNPAYGTTKGGVRQLTKALAFDWGQYGIRVNNLVPGYTHTPMNQKSWNDASLRQQRADHTMLGRWAEPEDMVGPVVFLASDASEYVTASDLHVDGGWTAKGL